MDLMEQSLQSHSSPTQSMNVCTIIIREANRYGKTLRCKVLFCFTEFLQYLVGSSKVKLTTRGCSY
jgi:hypothetical protein